MNLFKSFSSNFLMRNGKVVKNNKKMVDINGDQGTYKEYDFDNQIMTQKLSKREIDQFLNQRYPNFYISPDIFYQALEILNESSRQKHKREYPKNDPGIPDRHKIKFSRNLIENNKFKGKPAFKNKRCLEIEKKYKLKGSNIQSKFRTLYKKTMKSKTAKKKKKDSLTKDYNEYSTLCGMIQ